MYPDTARDLAMNLLQAAEAATGDALIFHFMSDLIGLDEQASGTLMVELRQLREKFSEEQQKE